MALHLDDKHFIFAIAPTIQALCQKDLFDKYHLNYFQYARCYPDGSFIVLNNRADVMRAFMDEGLFGGYAYTDDEIMKLHHYQFSWEGRFPEACIQLGVEAGDVGNGITFVERHKNFYDVIALGVPQSNHRIYETYINKLDSLKQFFIQFRNDNGDLFKAANAEKILMPDECYHYDAQKMLELEQAQEFLTKREFECVYLIKLMGSSKMVAKELRVSHRTVETLLFKAKEKLHVHSYTALARLLDEL